MGETPMAYLGLLLLTFPNLGQNTCQGKALFLFTAEIWLHKW